MHRTEETLRPHLQKYLIDMLSGELAESDLKSPQHEVIYKVHSWWLRHWQTACLAILPCGPGSPSSGLLWLRAAGAA